MTTPNYPTNPAGDDFTRRAQAAAEHAERALSDASMYRPEGADEVVDPAPVLAGQSPIYDTEVPDEDGQPEGTVDLSDMPPLRDLSRELPGVRYGYTADAVDVIRLIPEDVLKAGQTDADELTDGADGFDLSMLDKVSGMREVIPAAEKFVMSLAEDADVMREWLIQRGSVQVVMAAFNVAQAHVKN